MSRTRAGKEIWSDRPGERWPGIGDAARAMGVPRSTLSVAMHDGRECAGRRWFLDPPEWVTAAEAVAERRRAASVRCNPGRYGRVVNGRDVRTGHVYENGEPVARLAKGAAA